jgi:predicted nucleic acid-binding protein
MSDKVFIDTNIFVYAKLITDKDKTKHLLARSFLESLQNGVVVSTQVLSEFASVLIKHRILDNDIQVAISAIAENSVVSPVSLNTLKEAWKIKTRYQFSYWDSLIVASALENQCTTLFTEDLQHNQVIEEKLCIKNPFQEST